jgi:glycosyltransferase involved in cell wall biosynthesis
MNKLSGYILTYNSEKHLDVILDRMLVVCDELFLLDSGSKDNTISIANERGVKSAYRDFDNYTSQRNYAHSICQNEYVFWMDSDEIPSLELIDWINEEKRKGFTEPIYSFIRKNYVLGQAVRVLYPVFDPEYRERLCQKSILYETNLKVHETLDKQVARHRIPYHFDHFTFNTVQELDEKTKTYAKLYASQFDKKPIFFKLIFSPIAAWIKWYWLKGGYKDGNIGWKLGLYAFKFTWYKYKYALNP